MLMVTWMTRKCVGEAECCMEYRELFVAQRKRNPFALVFPTFCAISNPYDSRLSILYPAPEMAPLPAIESWPSFLRYVFRFAKPYRRHMALAVLLTLVATGADLLEPVIYKFAIDDLTGVFVHREAAKAMEPLELKEATRGDHRDGIVAPRTSDQALRSLVIAAALLLGISLLSRGAGILSDQVTARYSNNVERDFITRVHGHVMRLPLAFFSKRSSAVLGKQIDQSDQIAPVIRGVVQDVGAEVVRLTGVLVIMVSYQPRLALLAMASLPFYLLISRRMAKRLEGSTEQYYAHWEGVNETLLDSLATVKTVKLSGAEDRVSTKFRAVMAAAFGAFLERNTIENRAIFLQSTLIYAAKFGIFVYGGFKVLEHQLTPGDVVMFVALLDRLYDPIDELSSQYVTMQNHKISITRAIRLLHSGDEEAQGGQAPLLHGHVLFDHVDFSYKAGRPVLSSLSFALEAGTLTALVGPSGAGKTTAIDLLLKLYMPQKGCIRIDGYDVASLDPSLVRSTIGVVSADGAIFRGTLRENILFKKPDATDEELRQAVDAAGLHRTVERLPDGLETAVGERGVGLSLGERQRVQIARILVSKPRILVLDEATANLDYATEEEIRNTIAALRGHSTILVVAHRYSMVKDADSVLVLERGSVAAAGTVPEVYRSNEWFRRMADGANGTEPRLDFVRT